MPPLGQYAIAVIDKRIRLALEHELKKRVSAVAGGGFSVTPTVGGVAKHGHGSAAHTGLDTGDDHPQYQKESEKGVASGYAPLSSGVLVPIAYLGTGTPDGTKFLRDDGVFANPPAGAGAIPAKEDGSAVVATPTALDFRHGLDVSDSGGEARIAVDETELTITHAQTTGQGADDHHAEVHDHDGSPTPKLPQANTHETPDTDVSASSLHHTLGITAFKAAAGNHSHGAAGGTIPIYLPDAPPASPHANDDEFNDSDWTTGGVWTEWDHGAILTPAEDTRGLTLTPTAAANDKWCGVYRAVPDSPWAIATKVSMSNDIPATGDYFEAGFVLFQDPTSSTADHYSFGILTAVAGALRRGIVIELWSAYNALSSTTFSMEADGMTLMSGLYLRLVRSGTTYIYEWSTDGDGWTLMFSHTPAFTPTHVGLGTWKGSDRNLSSMFRFWRQIADTSLYARLDGQVLSL